MHAHVGRMHHQFGHQRMLLLYLCVEMVPNAPLQRCPDQLKVSCNILEEKLTKSSLPLFKETDLNPSKIKVND